MSDSAIKVENLSKKYTIGAQQRRHDTLRDLLMDTMRNFTNKKARNQENEFWALCDVSFEVKRGEVIGVIGRNGAGKSTLLKILSRITEPTSGRAVINGRVGSLLEVGTGFHPELTGRENIYLNGAILGMKREEIRRKFDEIVDFAEIEKFLDTPVKHYSSGMYVRLAFAVAAHLEPEILLVDEVLAVGDAAFQKKCLGKMGDIAGEGRTVLFVSHNMGAIEALCNDCIFLRNGFIDDYGSSTSIIETYLSINNNISTDLIKDRTDRKGSGDVLVTKIVFKDKNGKEINSIGMGEKLRIEVSYKINRKVNNPVWGFLFTNSLGQTVVRAFSRESYHGVLPPLEEGKTFCCEFPQFNIMHGRYYLRIWLAHYRSNVIDDIENAAEINVYAKDVYSTGIIPDSYNGGYFYLPVEWIVDDKNNNIS